MEKHRALRLIGRVIGLIVALAAAAAGAALIHSQFAAGWSGQRVNDGVTLFGIAFTAVGVVAIVLWVKTLLRARK